MKDVRISKSTIMRNAWKIKKEDNRYVFSICLKLAWKEAKKKVQE